MEMFVWKAVFTSIVAPCLLVVTRGHFHYDDQYIWSAWGDWSSCHVDCNAPVTYTSEQTRHRMCIDSHCLELVSTHECVEHTLDHDHVQFRSCSRVCTVDGGWGPWQHWSDTSHTCGLTLKTRQRSCDHPSPMNGGNPCVGSFEMPALVYMQPCPEVAVDGGWGNWQAWSGCSQTCGDGSKTRQRSCDSPSPEYGGAQCAGNSTMSTQCHMTPCPIAVDGGWGPWQHWSDTSHTCGLTLKTRQRSCDHPSPMNGGNPCVGSFEMPALVYLQPCPEVDGGWGNWQAWSGCSQTCGDGSKTRQRSCDSPSTEYGGAQCAGNSTMTTQCHMTPCLIDVDGGWGSWQPWSDASHTCGLTLKTRQRSCDHPPPMNGGNPCVGSFEMPALVYLQPCPEVDGGWGNWQAWSGCSQTCGDGSKTRQRSCDSPLPTHGGAQCAGNSTMSTQCHMTPCPIVDGGWGNWQAWSGCSQTCGDGSKTRQRSCDSPSPTQGGAQCTGNSTMTTQCHMTPCPIDGGWGAYVTYPCSVSCGTGVAEDIRFCSNPAPAFGGIYCKGQSSVFRPCKLKDCDIDGGWTAWTSWGDCDVVCGDGHKWRTRACSNPSPYGAGANCTGSPHERQLCHRDDCHPGITICKDDDILHMIKGVASLTDNATHSPYTACDAPQTMQEMLLGKVCKGTRPSVEWLQGIKLSGSCERIPLYIPIVMVDKQTNNRKYAILLDCYDERIQIIDVACRMKVQVLPLNHTTTDHYMIFM